ncbi:MAG: SCO1664 family protein [Candidatus Nanopelagicales bacterium]|nr:SCO1664 family protein [Candidatus Nanopelagicales bacterium]
MRDGGERGSEVFTISGRLHAASNQTFLCTDALDQPFVYKPVKGEQDLWDFPSRTLSGREIAAAEIDRVLGWKVVPNTRWISDGPLGAGMIQEWVPEVDQDRPVNVFPPSDVPPGWIVVLHAQDAQGVPLVLAHADTHQLQRMALFDAVINNGDRKAGHILATPEGRVYGIDHGVSFHVDNKLRTVLWGWIGQPVSDVLLKDLNHLEQQLNDQYEPVDQWLNTDESAALRARIRDLSERRVFPSPSPEWPAIPWPVF